MGLDDELDEAGNPSAEVETPDLNQETGEVAPLTGELLFELEDGSTIAVPANARTRIRHNKDEIELPAGELHSFGQIGFDGRYKHQELAKTKRELAERLREIKANPEAFKEVSEFYTWARRPENRTRAELIDLVYQGKIDPARMAAVANQMFGNANQQPAPQPKQQPKPAAEKDWMSGEFESDEETPQAEPGDAPPKWFSPFVEETKSLFGNIAKRLEAIEGGSAAARAQAQEEQARAQAKDRAQVWNENAIRTAGASQLIKQAFRGKPAEAVLKKLHEIRLKHEEPDPVKVVRLYEAELKGLRDAFLGEEVDRAAAVNDTYRPQRQRGASNTPQDPPSTEPVPAKLALRPGILGEQSRDITANAFRELFG